MVVFDLVTQHSTRAAWFALRIFGLSSLTAVAVSCRDEPITAPTQVRGPSFVLASGKTVEVRDVRGGTLDLRQTPLAYESSDSAFVVAMEESDHKAFIAFKRPEALRVMATARMARTKRWRPDPPLSRQGTRADVDARSIKAGLDLVTAAGGSVLSFYAPIGAAYIIIEPAAATKLRQNPLVDYFEPDLEKRYLTSSKRSIMSRSAKASLVDGTQVMPWGVSFARVPEAWSLSTGSGARLLIIDTGYDPSQPDLVSVPSSNCFGSQYGCADPEPFSHGTRVSGVAIARNNDFGIVGVAPGIEADHIYYWGACTATVPIACFIDEIVAGLMWAVDHLGPQGVINLSIAGTGAATVESDAIRYAWQANHVIVAAAGNNVSNVVQYPAKYDNVIGVSGINSDGTFAGQNTTAWWCGGSYSDYGEHVDISAAFDALTTWPGGYVSECGTSFATPLVSGIALLARARHPNWSNVTTRDNILFTAAHVGVGIWDPHYGSGLPRADLAIGLYAVELEGSVVAGHPRLSWPGVPLADHYLIYRRVWVNGVSDVGGVYSTTTDTTWDDSMQTSGFSNCRVIGTTLVMYWVTAVTATGIEGPQGYLRCFIPVGEIPQ